MKDILEKILNNEITIEQAVEESTQVYKWSRHYRGRVKLPQPPRYARNRNTIKYHWHKTRARNLAQKRLSGKGIYRYK
jgi:hypothetical protein